MQISLTEYSLFYGISVGTDYAHEDHKDALSKNPYQGFQDREEADAYCDLQNNIIGRDIGSNNGSMTVNQLGN